MTSTVHHWGCRKWRLLAIVGAASVAVDHAKGHESGLLVIVDHPDVVGLEEEEVVGDGAGTVSAVWMEEEAVVLTWERGEEVDCGWRDGGSRSLSCRYQHPTCRFVVVQE